MSSVSNLVEDAERIATELVPPTSFLAPVVGVLIKQVEQLAGKELPKLEDKVLGVPTPTPVVDDAAAAENAALKDRIAELERAAASQTPPAAPTGA